MHKHNTQQLTTTSCNADTSTPRLLDVAPQLHVPPARSSSHRPSSPRRQQVHALTSALLQLLPLLTLLPLSLLTLMCFFCVFFSPLLSSDTSTTNVDLHLVLPPLLLAALLLLLLLLLTNRLKSCNLYAHNTSRTECPPPRPLLNLWRLWRLAARTINHC
jgi:hypothetical protein